MLPGDAERLGALRERDPRLRSGGDPALEAGDTALELRDLLPASGPGLR